jgi:acyl dehydratase
MTATMLGAEVGPVRHDLDARWLMAYAAALGEGDPRYFDTRAAAGPLGHPLFPVCYEWPAAVALRDKTIPADLQPRGVHATHHLTIHRPPRGGDRLLTTARVIGLGARRAGTLVVTRLETVDGAGGRVTTTDYGSVYRDVSLRDLGEPEPPGPRASAPASPAGDGASQWQERVDVPATLALVYTECARIWNPIHTDVAVASAAGLAAPILHGTATLALAVSRALRHRHSPDAAAVSEVSARFTGMVAMPSTLTVRGRDLERDGMAFDVVGAGGAQVITAGRLAFRLAG